MRANLFGGFYVSRSRNVAYNQCINLYPEIVETKDGEDVGALYSVPGLTRLATVGDGPCRGLQIIDNSSNLMYMVSGDELYSLDASYSSSLLGTLSSASSMVSMIANTTQLAIFDGVNGYLWDTSTSTFSTIPLPFSSPVIATYQDGFGLVNESGTNNWWQSNYKDLSTWQALNFAQADSRPDPINSMLSLHRLVYLFGTNGTEIWANAGVPGFTFQRVDGMFMEAGCIAPYSVASVGESLCWVGGNQQGQGLIYALKGPSTPEVISTQALTNSINQFTTIQDAIAYSYTQDGHLFYQVTFPSGNETWTYDMGTHLWHQRAAFSEGEFNRHWSQGYVFYNNANIVGDYRNGNIYALDLSNYTNNGEILKWLRSFEVFPPGEVPRTAFTFSTIELMMETGMTVPDGLDPQIGLRWSDDGGNTWSTQRTISMGKTGETGIMIRWKRCGSTRKNHGLSRILEFTSNDPVRAALIGCRINEDK